MNDKLRVVWLCQFSNAEKREHIRYWRIINKEQGQWIPNLLMGFIGDSNFELHVITVDPYMCKTYDTWAHGNVIYHCFQPLIPFLGGVPKMPLDPATKYRWNRFRIKKLIRNINPDVIHLFGVENPEYGSVVLDLPNSMPIVCTIQGFISREMSLSDCFTNRVRAQFEVKLMKRISHYTGDYDSEKYVRKFNEHIDYFHMYLPVNEMLIAQTSKQPQQFDVLFSGRSVASKGLVDFIKIISICIKSRPNLRAAIVASSTESMEITKLARELCLENNITWTGRFPTQEGLFCVYRKSRVFLAPTYNDAFPSTIRENMFLGTPCIAYETGGIPYANNDGHENVVVVPQGGVDAMAEKVLYYLDHEDERIALASRAKAYAEKTFSLATNVAVIKKTYKDLLANRR